MLKTLVDSAYVLTFLQNHSASDRHRLGIAIAHLEAAISQINNEAQCHVPGLPHSDPRYVDDLRLMVRTLGHVIEALRSMDHIASDCDKPSPGD